MRRELGGSARLVLADGVTLLDPVRAVFERILTGWERQQQARLLAVSTISRRLGLVRRFAEFTNEYPWQWLPGDVEEFIAGLRSGSSPAAWSTLRHYQTGLRLLCEFVKDSRYGWAAECEWRFGAHPVQIC